MPLDITNVVDGNSPIPAAAVTQFYDVLLGIMTDQPLSPKNRMTIGGNQATGDNTLTLVGVSGQTGFMMRLLKLVGDAQPVLATDNNGKFSWGAGGAAAADTTMERFGTVPGFLKFDTGGFVVRQVATPAAPGANLNSIYPKSDGFWYTRAGAAGAETAIGGTNITDPLVAQVFC